MKRGDMVWHKSLGVCLVADNISERDTTVVIIAASQGGVIRFMIGNDADLVPITISPELERLRGMLRGMPAIPLPGEK